MARHENPLLAQNGEEGLMEWTQDKHQEASSHMAEDTESLANLEVLARDSGFHHFVFLVHLNWNDVRLFFAILFTLGIPSLIQSIFFTALMINNSSFIFPPEVSDQAPGSIPQDLRGPLNGNVLPNWLSYLWIFFATFGEPVQCVISVLTQVCRALWVAGTIHAVGMIYSPSPDYSKHSVISLLGLLMCKVPGLWCRLMYTWLWQVLFMAIPLGICVASFSTFLFLKCPLGITIFLGVVSIASLLCTLRIGIIADMAAVITVLDPKKSCGSVAFKKGKALLRDGQMKLAVLYYCYWRAVLMSSIRPLTFSTGANRITGDGYIRILKYGVASWLATQCYDILRGVLVVVATYPVWFNPDKSDVGQSMESTEATTSFAAKYPLCTLIILLACQFLMFVVFPFGAFQSACVILTPIIGFKILDRTVVG